MPVYLIIVLRAVVDVFDTVNSSWSQMLMTQARAYLSCVQVGTRLLFAGGEKAGVPLSGMLCSHVYVCIYNYTFRRGSVEIRQIVL